MSGKMGNPESSEQRLLDTMREVFMPGGRMRMTMPEKSRTTEVEEDEAFCTCNTADLPERVDSAEDPEEW